MLNLIGAILFYLIAVPLKIIYNVVIYVYLNLLPFLVLNIGIPLFIIGCIFGLASSGAVLITLVVAVIVYYLYVKKVYGLNPLKEMKKTEEKKMAEMGQQM